MNSKLLRIKRSLTPGKKRRIPIGPYCYDTIKRFSFDDGIYRPPLIKACPYYIRDKDGQAICTFCGVEASWENNLLNDMVKICGEFECYGDGTW